MDNSFYEIAPDEKKKKELKTFIFTRNIQNEEQTPKRPIENKENIPKPEKDEIKDNILLTFYLYLYEDEIVFNVKERKENLKISNIIYEKSFLPEYFKEYKTLSLPNLEKKYDLIQKSFELNYDHITLEENELKIKIMINIMDIITEEIIFEIPMIKMTNQDEVLSFKETVKFLGQEINNQTTEKENTQENIIVELKNIIEANKIEFQKKLEHYKAEFQKKIEEKENDIQKKIEGKEYDLLKQIKENDNLFNNKIKEIQEQSEKRENEIFTTISKHNEEIKALQITQKYVKEKLICEEKENEEERKTFI